MLASRPGDETRTVADRREEARAGTASSAGRFQVRHDRVAAVPVERHEPAGSGTGSLLLFAHGGAYVTGSPQTHRGLAAHLAEASRLQLLSIDYRLAPEWPFPAGRDDVVAVYAALLESGVEKIGLVGDSSGGGLMMQAALAIRDNGLPAPAAIAITSPWVDLACRGTSHETQRHQETMLSTAGLRLDADRYLGGRRPDDPLVSPIYADLAGLPPVLIQVGEHEILADDAVSLVLALERSDVPATLEIWEGMTHAWQAFRHLLPESEAAVARLAAFLRASVAA